MATSYQVSDIYNLVCEALCEPYRDGLANGLELGIFTEQEFLDLFAVVLLDFLNKTGISKTIFTQQVTFNTSQYVSPPDIIDLQACFVAGIYIDHATLPELDDWIYGWKTMMGQPEYWHEDGLPVKTIELALTPNYTGSSYTIPVGPSYQPPFGEYDVFCTPTNGNLTMVGTTGLLTDTFALDDVIPVVPDSLCYGLFYGIMAEVFTNNSECRDEQRAAWCMARYQESVSLAAAVGGQPFYE